MINVTTAGTGFDLFVDIDVSTIAEAIRQDVETNLTKQRSYDGSDIAPLKDSYKKLKQRKLGHTRIFDGFRTGNKKLINSIKTKKVSQYHYMVYVGNNNSDIMYYLQEGKSPLAGPRKAFGISEQGLKRIARLLNESILIKHGAS